MWRRRWAISRAESVISSLLDGPVPFRGSARSTVSANLRTASIALLAPSSSDLMTSSDSSVLRSTALLASSSRRTDRALRADAFLFAAGRFAAGRFAAGRFAFVSGMSFTTSRTLVPHVPSRKRTHRTPRTCESDSTAFACLLRR